MVSQTEPCTEQRPPAAGQGDSNRVALWSPAGVYLASKAAADFFCALVLLVLTAPLILLAMVLVKLTSPGPALYCQIRLGRHGKPFTIYKLRTMYDACESLTGARWSPPGDSRVTVAGRWLRLTHLDELPQLWNVLRGEMSLVGPRPERPEFVLLLEPAIPHYRERLLVRPGVTGLAQVQLPPDSDLASVRLKLAYDLYYVRKISLWLDLRLGLATACKMLGFPFRLIRSFFSLPPKEVIEAAYTQLVLFNKLRKASPTNTNGKGNGKNNGKHPDAGAGSESVHALSN